MAITKITTGVISLNAVTATIVAENVITSSELATNAVDTLQITNEAVTSAKLDTNIDVAGTLDVTGVLTADSNVVIAGNLTVNGTTVTNSSTNTTIEDALIELGTGTSGTPANDAGIIIERGSAANAFIGFDESADKFIVATTTATGSSTGDLTLTAAPLVTGALTASGISYPTSDGSSAQVLQTDGSGNLSFGTVITGGAVVHNYTATGDGSTATFDTGINPQDEVNTWVHIDGVYQNKSEYSYNGTSITFTSAPDSGAAIDIISGTQSGFSTADSVLGVYSATTTDTDTYDTGLSATNENNVNIFIEGVYQPKSTYTWSGSTITFDANTPVGLSLEVMASKTLTSGAVVTASIADDAVTAAKLASDSVVSASIVNNSITGADISATTSIVASTFTGNLVGNVTGNLVGNVTGTLQTAAQPNITSVGTLTALTGGTGDLNWDSGTLFVDSSANKVGIGTTSPQAKFVVSNSGAGGFEFEPDTTSFSVANTNYIASYDRSASAYRDIVVDLGGAASQAVRFKAGGNLGIGTSSPAAKLDIHMSDSNGDYGRGRDGNLNLENTNTSVTEGGWLSISGYMGNTASSGQYQMGAISGGKHTTAADGDYGGYLTLWTTSGGANGEANSGGYERMRIDSSGNVGIGVTNPDAYYAKNLVVAAPDEGGISVVSNSTHQAYLMFADGTSGSQAYRGYLGYDHNNDNFNIISNGIIKFYTDDPSVERMRIDTSGRVGIGTSNPSHTLHVVSSGNGEIKAERTSGAAVIIQAQSAAGKIGTTTNHNLGLNTNGTTRLTIDTNGKVGIGSTAPTARLDVSASIGSDIAQTSTHTYSSNRNWAMRTNNYGSSNWGGWSLERSSAAGGTPNKAYIGVHANGNVGIGYGGSAGSGGWDGYNDNPTARLHVGGDIKSTLQVIQGNSDGTPRYINIPYSSAGSGFSFNFEDLATHPGVSDQATETNAFMFEVNVTSYLFRYVKALIIVDTNSTNSISVVTLHNSTLTCSATIPTGSEVITVTIGGLWGNATNYMGRITTF